MQAMKEMQMNAKKYAFASGDKKLSLHESIRSLSSIPGIEYEDDHGAVVPCAYCGTTDLSSHGKLCSYPDNVVPGTPWSKPVDRYKDVPHDHEKDCVKEDAIIKPMEPVQIQIGTFGMLKHDPKDRFVSDDSEDKAGGLSTRHIDIPDADFDLMSESLLVYSWRKYAVTGEWHGSEKIRREREQSEVPVRASASVPYGPESEGSVHRAHQDVDHPEGCRARALEAGFGCLVGGSGSYRAR